MYVDLMQGLFMEGARWNRSEMCIDEAESGHLFDSMPLMLLKPYKQAEAAAEIECLYEAPVYRTTSRRSLATKFGHLNNFVTFFALKCNKLPTHWLFRGVALFCQLDD